MVFLLLILGFTIKQNFKNISFEEMLELSSAGAKVLQLRAVEYASKFNLPLRVLSSFKDGEGTLVQEEREYNGKTNCFWNKQYRY